MRSWGLRGGIGNAFLTLFHVLPLSLGGLGWLRKRILYAISRVRAQFGRPRIASETHFVRYFTCSRSVWVASNNFGNAFCTLFHAFALSLGGHEWLI